MDKYPKYHIHIGSNSLKNRTMIPILALGAKMLAGILLGTTVYKTYVTLPQRILYGRDPHPLPDFKEDSLFLIFPGFGGVDENIAKLEQQVIMSDESKWDNNRFVYTYNWTQWRGNTFRAAFDSQLVGEVVGRSLAKFVTYRKKPLKQLHVVGVSVGAFAADQCVKEYKATLKSASNNTYTRLTLLDPFTARGVFGQGYGAKNFGLCSDYCEHFVNTDDPVPFTNEDLPFTLNFDVTSNSDRKEFKPLPGDSMHSWPLAFYARNWKDKIDPRNKNPNFPSSFTKLFPRGMKIKL